MPPECKTGAREVPLPAHLVYELRGWQTVNGTSDKVLGITWLASSLNAKLNGQTRIWKGKAAGRTKGVLDKLGIPRFTPKGLRKLAVDTLYRNTAIDIATSAALLGHSEQTALREYRKATPADKRVAVAGLGRVHDAESNIVAFPGSSG